MEKQNEDLKEKASHLSYQLEQSESTVKSMMWLAVLSELNHGNPETSDSLFNAEILELKKLLHEANQGVIHMRSLVSSYRQALSDKDQSLMVTSQELEQIISQKDSEL